MSTPNVNHPAKISPPQTGQTGQEHTPFIEVKQDNEGNWHWCLWAGNGRMVAINGVTYSRKKDVFQAVGVLADVAAKAKVVVVSHDK